MEEKKKKPVAKTTEAAAETKAAPKLTKAEEKSKATTLRIVSIILWVLAIGFEVVAILSLLKALYIPWLPQMWAMIICIVLDLVCCIIAALLWKKASYLDPFKKTNNKVGFVILNQLGVIMAVICFLPLIILLFTNKDKMDKKSRIIVTVVAIVALLIAGLFGVNFNPISAEEKAAAEEQITDTVYWTAFGHKYHLYKDCHTIANSEKNPGTVTDAIDAGRTEVCYYCAHKAEKEKNLKLESLNIEEGVEAVSGE
ncbi:MAG: hypothetical protein IJL62_06505 [Clostridia bacterium]|nr:hypothetical protein [Clostridia bacterium]